jgi:transposase
MKQDGKERRFSREFKLAALARMAAGENVSALCRELGIRRKCIYQWRERFRLGGPAALRGRGRPTKAEALAMRPGAELEPPVDDQAPPPESPDALSRARARIAALERKVGRQQVDLDFFKGALRRIEASPQPRRDLPSPGPFTSASGSSVTKVFHRESGVVALAFTIAVSRDGSSGRLFWAAV